MIDYIVRFDINYDTKAEEEFNELHKVGEFSSDNIVTKMNINQKNT